MKNARRRAGNNDARSAAIVLLLRAPHVLIRIGCGERASERASERRVRARAWSCRRQQPSHAFGRSRPLCCCGGGGGGGVVNVAFHLDTFPIRVVVDKYKAAGRRRRHRSRRRSSTPSGQRCLRSLARARSRRLHRRRVSGNCRWQKARDNRHAACVSSEATLSLACLLAAHAIARARRPRVSALATLSDDSARFWAPPPSPPLSRYA